MADDLEVTLAGLKCRSALEERRSLSLFLVRYNLIQSSAFPVTLNQSLIPIKRMAWSVLSKAVQRSSRVMAVTLPSFIDDITMHENQPAYLHSMLAVSLPSRQTKELVWRSLGSRPTQVEEHFNLVHLLVGTTSHCLSIQPFQLLLSRYIWRHISVTWPFPHRHQHTWWPIDVTELLHRFWCWTPIWLSHH